MALVAWAKAGEEGKKRKKKQNAAFPPYFPLPPSKPIYLAGARRTAKTFLLNTERKSSLCTYSPSIFSQHIEDNPVKHISFSSWPFFPSCSCRPTEAAWILHLY